MRMRLLAPVLMGLGLVALGFGLLTASVQASFPDPVDQWLSFKGTGNPGDAQLYYDALDLLPGSPVSDTLDAWKAHFGFPANETVAIYYNAGDLGFGREMHCRRNGNDVACYVVNHGFGPGGPPVPSVDAAIAGQQVIATVAMVYRDSLNGSPNDVSFYIFDKDGNRIPAAALDGEGDKYVPYLCLACHGGSTPVTVTEVVDASFLPFDEDSFVYSSQPGFTRADQEEEFRQLNEMVFDTNPTDLISTTIAGWYTNTTLLRTPGTRPNLNFVAPNFDGNAADQELYLQVYKPYCRTCHMAQALNLDNPISVRGSTAKFYAFTQFIMPHAERTNHFFWTSGGPIKLANNAQYTLTVTRTDDPVPNGCSTGDCSLREAIIDANAAAGDISIITFAIDGTFTLSRAGSDDNANAGDLDLTSTEKLFILGNGAGQTIIDGGSLERVFHKLGTGDVVIQGVTIQGGDAGSGDGGGLDNAVGLTVINLSVITGNDAGRGGGLANAPSAGLEINMSTIGPANLADEGGGLYNSGTLTITNATLGENFADAGGALSNTASGVATLEHATVVLNDASSSGASTGGLLNAGTVNLKNSIVAGSVTGSDCSGAGTFVSRDFNLFGENGATGGCPAGTDDQVVAGAIASVLNTTLSADPLPSYELLPGSPALDAIPLSASQNCATPSYDQHNVARPLAGAGTGAVGCDIGAVETKLQLIFLPLIPVNPMPDLVGSLFLTPDTTSFNAGDAVQVTAVITNQGTASTSSGFWVDLYINPAAAPTVNQPWYSNCGLVPCRGIAWYVSVSLAPGESITLTSTPGSFSAPHTDWPGSFVAGTTDLYLLVDSWNPPIASGAVTELSEANNQAALHGLVVTGTSASAAGAGQSFADRYILPAQ
jgi:hypothetical protein